MSLHDNADTTGLSGNVLSTAENGHLSYRSVSKILWLYYMDLKQINAACRVTPQKPIQKLHDLPIDFPNEIICAKQVSGKFVSQILLELEDCVVFLPQRATSVLENHVDSLKGYRLVFRGTRNFGSQHHETADFEFLEPL
ncbi:hypothetical protein ABEB36_013873 [Hypothenemus hampei]|uniref:Uncharacterized protein n=1 Tax=Hypothenemus hampei TaxID=57062 RepID=A0ABD1E892_HYPHA